MAALATRAGTSAIFTVCAAAQNVRNVSCGVAAAIVRAVALLYELFGALSALAACCGFTLRLCVCCGFTLHLVFGILQYVGDGVYVSSRVVS